MKTRPSKIKNFLWNFILITYVIVNHYQKGQKSSFIIAGLKFLWIFVYRVVYRWRNDNVLFRIFIDSILLRVLSYRVLFESPVIESSSGSAVLGSFYESLTNALFPSCCYFYIKICTIFLSKTDILFYIHYILKSNY